MRKTIHSFLLLLLLMAFLPMREASARSIAPYRKPKGIVLRSRLIARVPTLRLTSLGLNYESYIFELDVEDREKEASLIKVSYRFHLGEPAIPSALMDYSLIHQFRMVRDTSCDERWDSISTRYLFDHGDNYLGERSALLYSANAPMLNPGERTVLACYVITPRDYQSTKSSQDPVAKARRE